MKKLLTAALLSALFLTVGCQENQVLANAPRKNITSPDLKPYYQKGESKYKDKNGMAVFAIYATSKTRFNVYDNDGDTNTAQEDFGMIAVDTCAAYHG